MEIELSKMPRSYCAGLVSTLTAINFHSGEKGLREKIMERVMPRVGEPISYLAGIVSALAAEVAIPIYFINEDFPWYYVLGVDAAIKIIPRAAERIIGARQT